MTNQPELDHLDTVINRGFEKLGEKLGTKGYKLFWTLACLTGGVFALRHLAALSRMRQLQAIQSLFDEIDHPKCHEWCAILFSRFCNDGFHLNSPVSPDVKESVLHLIRAYSRVGTLVQHAGLSTSLVVRLHSDVCIRLWLVTEDFIRTERKRRTDPLWQAAMEYLTLVSLRFGQTEITVYHPDDSLRSKTYTRVELISKLQELENELNQLGLPIR